MRAVDELNASISDPLDVRGYKLDLENNKTFKTSKTSIRKNIRCLGTELQDNPDLGSSACKLRRSPESLTTSEPVPTHKYSIIKKIERAYYDQQSTVSSRAVFAYCLGTPAL